MDRFEAKFIRGSATECWEWQAARNDRGYGLFRGDGEQLAHRTAYRLAFGDIPAGLHVCHDCDNPPCVNPGHFFLGTNADNVADKVAKGRSSRTGGGRGEANSQAQLTAAQIDEIVETYRSGSVTQKELGARFGIGQSAVSNIVRANRWAHRVVDPVDGCNRRARGARHHNTKLTPEQVADIRNRYSLGGITQQALADEYGVSQPTVGALILNRTHRLQN